MAKPRVNAALRCLFRAPAYLYHWRCCWLLGNRFLMLIHVGRRTGLRRETVLEVLSYRPEVSEWIVMSGFGPEADWLRNIQVTNGPEVIVGKRHFTANCRFLNADVGTRIIEDYENRNYLVAPLIRLVLSRLLGWRYRATEMDRRRAVTQLPLAEFRPRQQHPTD